MTRIRTERLRSRGSIFDVVALSDSSLVGTGRNCPCRKMIGAWTSAYCIGLIRWICISSGFISLHIMCGPYFPSFTSLGFIRMAESSWAIPFMRIGDCLGRGVEWGWLHYTCTEAIPFMRIGDCLGRGEGWGYYITLVPNFEKFVIARFKESQAIILVQSTRFIFLYETFSSLSLSRRTTYIYIYIYIHIYICRAVSSLTFWRRNYFFNFSTPCI